MKTPIFLALFCAAPLALAQSTTTLPSGTPAPSGLQEALTTLVETVPVSSAARGRAGAASGGREEHLILGLELDAGVPHLSGANVVISPWEWLQLTVGGIFTGGSGGGRLGTRFMIPGLASVMGLGLALEGGIAHGGLDLITDLIMGAAGFGNAVIENVTMAYGSSTVHLEIGARHLRLAIDLGVAYVHNWLGQVSIPGPSGTDPTVLQNAQEWHVVPAGHVGLQVFFPNP